MPITFAANSAEIATEVVEQPLAFVIILGICTVFLMLISLIFLCKIMSAIVGSVVKTPAKPAVAPAPVKAAAPVQDTASKSQLIAAIGVAIAEEMGTDVSRIRIHSIKKI